MERPSENSNTGSDTRHGRDDTLNIATTKSSSSSPEKKKKNEKEEETERWLLVRNTLLQSPKLAPPLAEISGADWAKFPVSSLKRVLEICSNYHGGPKGEMWSEVTCAVRQHLGPDHEYLEMISEHQDSLWTTCSLVTVTTISETSLEGRGIEEMSISATPSLSVTATHQPYGSIDLIEPTGNDGQRMCMHHFHWKWLLLYLPLFVVLAAAVAVATTLLETKPEETKRIETFESTTIYLDSQKGVWYKGWEVSDCSATGGGAMGGASGEQLEKIASNIQLVDSDDVILFEENVTTDEVEGYQSGPLLKTLNEPLYLLAGSIVEYQFCLTSNSSAPNFPHVQSYGEFLIFNDVMNYANYIHRSGESGKESAIFYRQTLIPSTGKSCTNETFRVSKPDFYFTMYKLPPNVELHYHSNIHVVYLNYTKYLPNEQMECDLSVGGSCEIEIPENTFSTEDYTILAYIPIQSPDIAPNSTHLCVTPKQSILVSVIPGVVSGCVLLLLVVVLVCQIISFVSGIRRRKGYICIKPINV